MAWRISPRSVNDANGSNSEVRARHWAVRFTPRTDVAAGPVRSEKCQKHTCKPQLFDYLAALATCRIRVPRV